MTDSGQLVSSGSFRIDRTRALEKLKEFQLPDPALLILSVTDLDDVKFQQALADHVASEK
jgi:hypothetical protein